MLESGENNLGNNGNIGNIDVPDARLYPVRSRALFGTFEQFRIRWVGETILTSPPHKNVSNVPKV